MNITICAVTSRGKLMTVSSLSTIIKSHQEAVQLSFDVAGRKLVESLIKLIILTLRKGNKILICGNGGSAADSQHFAAEFVGRFRKEREGLPAIALTTDTSALTAIANDYGYENIFSRQVEALGKNGDILIVISTSGNSPNILKAVETANKMGIITVGFSGKDGGKLKNIADHCFISKASETPQIQEVHEIALHAICEIVEEEIEHKLK
jgi:D-sedoheptulose 7-phosphate isomerase